MKTFTIVIVLLFSTSVFATNLNSIVLAIDHSDFELVPSYPCDAYMSVVFCNKSVILEKGCAKTLEISKDSLSCTSLSGDRVVFGTFSSSDYFEDETQEAGAYTIHYSPRAQLKEFKTPNGNSEFQVIVK